jgi:glycogen synthase
MHIVLVNRWYPPYTGWGGVAAYNYYLAHALTELGHTMTVVASRLTNATPAIQQDCPATVHRLQAREYYYLGRLPLFGRYARPYLQFQYSRQVAHFLYHFIKQARPDIVEFAEINAEGFSYLHQRNRLPVVVRCHTPTFILTRYYTPQEMPFDTTLTGRMEKFCIHHADALSAPSLDMAQTVDAACSIVPSRFTVIPNPLDTARFAPAKGVPIKSSATSSLTILHIGRLDRVKGIEVLAQAIPKVIDLYPQARFVFIGDDRSDGMGSNWKKRLVEYFQGQNVADSVQLLGNLPQEEVISWYRKADIAVVPSLLYESFSYTCAQAMAAGLPVVASRVGGIPETIGDCGMIVEPGSVSELVDSILKLANSPGLRQSLGEQARLRASQVFDSIPVAREAQEFYQEHIRQSG